VQDLNDDHKDHGSSVGAGSAAAAGASDSAAVDDVPTVAEVLCSVAGLTPRTRQRGSIFAPATPRSAQQGTGGGAGVSAHLNGIGAMPGTPTAGLAAGAVSAGSSDQIKRAGNQAEANNKLQVPGEAGSVSHRARSHSQLEPLTPRGPLQSLMYAARGHAT